VFADALPKVNSTGGLCCAGGVSSLDPVGAQSCSCACCLLQVIAHELEFISKQAKGQQTKGRARQRRYDELVAAANDYVKDTKVGLSCSSSGCRTLQVTLLNFWLMCNDTCHP